MPTTVLVTWATRYGSTEEVAHAIADDLLKQKFAVTAQPMSQVGSLERYQAVVMGFALYIGRIHKDARHFLVPIGCSSCSAPSPSSPSAPCMPKKRSLSTRASSWTKELAKFPWFSPVARQVIGGRFDPQKLALPVQLSSPSCATCPPATLATGTPSMPGPATCPSTLVAAPTR